MRSAQIFLTLDAFGMQIMASLDPQNPAAGYVNPDANEMKHPLQKPTKTANELKGSHWDSSPLPGSGSDQITSLMKFQGAGKQESQFVHRPRLGKVCSYFFSGQRSLCFSQKC